MRNNIFNFLFNKHLHAVDQFCQENKVLITNQILKLVCFSDRTTAAAKFYKMEHEAFLTVE